MTKILAIGNSFSEDATAYLYDMAKLGNKEAKVVNISLDSSVLSTHWLDIIADKADYSYQLNGELAEGKKISLHDALVEDEWDIVTLQQSSNESGLDATYYPFVKNLSAFIKKFAPKARQYINQPWAYEKDCTDSGFAAYENDQQKMHRQIVLACQGAARNIKAKIIPCGEIFQLLRAQDGFLYEEGQQSLCRDGRHADLVYGRYTLAAVWYEMLFESNVTENYYLPPSQGKGVDQRLIDTIKKTIHETVKP